MLNNNNYNNNNNRILVTDDQPEILEDYLRILSPVSEKKEEELASLEADLFGTTEMPSQTLSWIEKTYTVTTASQGDEAICLVKRSLEEGEPFAVAFLDIRMPPGLNGVMTAKEIRNIDHNIEIVFVTAYSDIVYSEILHTLGSSGRLLYLRKPFDANEIKQLAMTLTEKWNMDKVIKKKTEELKLTHIITIHSLAELAELRDTDTGNHLKRVTQYSRLVAGKLSGFEEPKWCNYITDQYIEDIGQSSVLHDIGKIGIPDTILLKPGPLTAEEFECMKTHTIIGGDALSKADKEMGIQSFLTLGKEIAYYHHEKFDGSGYPKGLKGEEIPLSARIVALADVYDALTSDRPYRKALSHEAAFRIITGEMGDRHFDQVILRVFNQNQEEFKKIRHTNNLTLFLQNASDY